MKEIQRLLTENLTSGVNEGIFPGGIACYMNHHKTNTSIYGNRGISTYSDGHPMAVSNETVYDIASLTKVIVTLPMILLSVQSGKLRLTDEVVKFLPQLSTGNDVLRKQKITIKHLLTHTSGLPAWRPYFVKLNGAEAYLNMIAQEMLEHEPGQLVVYSDLGFMLLGWVLEAIWDEPLDRLADKQLFQPLAMTSTSYNPLQHARLKHATIAPTEQGNLLERNMALDYINNYEAGKLNGSTFDLHQDDLQRLEWRVNTIMGTVHDANCYYGLNGVSGHAGLFSTMGDICRYMQIWQQPHRISNQLIEEAIRCQAVTGSLRRGFGWMIEEDGIVGHTGFTGTSIWFSPHRDRILVVLTNRVHPEVKDGIAGWRQSLRRAVFAQEERRSQD